MAPMDSIILIATPGALPLANAVAERWRRLFLRCEFGPIMACLLPKRPGGSISGLGPVAADG
jgi:hypothetical protein